MAHEHGLLSSLMSFQQEVRRVFSGPSSEVSALQALAARIADLERGRVEDQRLIVAQRARIEELEAEKKAWIQERGELLARIAVLEERLNTNSRNSSKPASQDRPDQKPPRTRQGRLTDGHKRSRGGQPGHPGHHRPLLDISQVDHVEKVPCTAECECGGRVEPKGAPYRFQQVGLPVIRVEVTEFQLGHGMCVKCGKVHRAELPAGVAPGMFGASVLAFIALMVGAYQLSRRSVQAVLLALTGLEVSASTVSEAEERISEALLVPYEEGRTGVQKATEANFDETGSRSKGKRSWIWLAASATVAVFLVSPSRGRQAFVKLLDGLFQGIMTSDRWHTYNRHATKLRQLCFAHLLRDFQKIADRGGASGDLGARLIEQTLQMFSVWGKFRDQLLTRDQLREQMVPIREALEQQLLEGTLLEKAPQTVETCRNILKLKEALWTFVERDGVEPTNNRAERLIRNAVIWRNRSLGTWSERGDRYLERLLTVMVSLRIQNRPALPWLTAVIHAHYGHGTRPSLLPN